MTNIEQIKNRIVAVIPGVRLEAVPNESPANQPSLLVDKEHAVAVARFLRDDPELRLDYASNVTGVDWLERRAQGKGESQESGGGSGKGN